MTYTFDNLYLYNFLLAPRRVTSLHDENQDSAQVLS